MYGQVVGINSSKIITDGYEGMGFAIPVSKAQAIINELLSGGYVKGRTRLGIQGKDVSAMQMMYGAPQGFVIMSIDSESAFSGTAAEDGDIITALDGEEVTGLSDISNLLLRYAPGDKVKLPYTGCPRIPWRGKPSMWRLPCWRTRGDAELRWPEKKVEKTNAVRILEQKKLPFSLHSYCCEEFTDGTAVADLLGEPREQVFKTLVTVGKSGGYTVFVIPVAEELDRKKARSSRRRKVVGAAAGEGLFPSPGMSGGGCTAIGMKSSFRRCCMYPPWSRIPYLSAGAGWACRFS